MKIGLAAASAVLVFGLSVSSQPPLISTSEVPAPTPAVVADPTPVESAITGSLLIGPDQGTRPENIFLCSECPWILLVCRR